MNGFRAFLGKEARETRKTWRLWVIPGILVFFGITSPILAAVTPALLRAMAGRSPGVVVRFPPPTAADAYLQYLGNLAQVALLAIIITGAAAVASERRSGTAVLMLTKPLSRGGFIVAKAVVSIGLLVVATALGSALCIVTTIALFDATLIGSFLASILVWLALAAMLTTLMLLFSATMNRQAPAAGAGIGAYVALFVLTGFPLVRDYSPAGLMAANDAILNGRDVALLWPLVTTVALTAVFAAAAVAVFRRKVL